MRISDDKYSIRSFHWSRNWSSFSNFSCASSLVAISTHSSNIFFGRSLSMSVTVVVLFISDSRFLRFRSELAYSMVRIKLRMELSSFSLTERHLISCNMASTIFWLLPYFVSNRAQISTASLRFSTSLRTLLNRYCLMIYSNCCVLQNGVMYLSKSSFQVVYLRAFPSNTGNFRPSNFMKGCCWRVPACTVFSVFSVIVNSCNFLCTAISILEKIFAKLLTSSAFTVAASASFKLMTMYSSCAT